MLTHANFIADMAGAFIGGLTIRPTDVHISYLPLAHVCCKKTPIFFSFFTKFFFRFLRELCLMQFYIGEDVVVSLEVM